MCVNQKIRSKNYKKYIYCAKRKQKISFDECKNCNEKTYKEVKVIKKSKNHKRIEEYSIMPQNKLYSTTRKQGLHRHEVFLWKWKKTD